MPPGNIIGLVLGLTFGVLLWALSPAKVFFVVIGLAVTLTLVRKPLWGLLIFAVLATSIPYTTLELGIRTTVSEAVLGLTWDVSVRPAFDDLRGSVPVPGTGT